MPSKDLSKAYERRLDKLIRAYFKRVQAIYNDTINQVSLFSAIAPTSEKFLTQSVIDTYPALKIKLDQLMSQMHDGIYNTVATSIHDAWQLSNQKNDLIADTFFADMAIVPAIKDLAYSANEDALAAFITRKEKGMDLSKRVWNLVEPYKFELEAGLQDGISKGKSAASMATDMKKYLNEPDKLFRRVKDKETGKLRLSKAARDYHPGQGVYRSSYQNALRLTGTETNISYRSSDHERWKQQDFTKGIEVKTSNNHPFFDECDALKGEYPKDFKFTGWHPRCRCYSTPILVTDDEFDKQQDYNLGLTDKPPVIEEVKSIPADASKWITDNAERIKGWSNVPYFIKDNPKFVKPLMKTKKK